MKYNQIENINTTTTLIGKFTAYSFYVLTRFSISSNYYSCFNIWSNQMWSIFGLFQKNIKYAICQKIKISTDWYPLLFLQNNCFLSTLNIILYYCSCRIIKQVSLRSTSTSKWSVLYSVLLFLLKKEYN